MSAVADIMTIAKPLPAAVASVPGTEEDDFSDHLLRAVEVPDGASDEESSRETPTDTEDSGNTEVAATQPPATPPAPLLPSLPLAAVHSDLILSEPSPVAAPPAAAAPPVGPQPPRADGGAMATPVMPAAPASGAPANLPLPAGTTAGSALPATPTQGAAPIPAVPMAAMPPPSSAGAAPMAARSDAGTAPPAGMSPPEGVALPEGEAIEAATILQLMGPRLAQTPSAAPMTPAAQAGETAPLRVLREAAATPSATGGSDATTAGTPTAAAPSQGGGAKTGTGDLGFKTDLGSVFAALSASGETADQPDFRGLVANQGRAAHPDLPPAEIRPATPAPGAGPATPALAAAAPAAVAGTPEPAHHAAPSRPAAPLPPTPAALQVSVQMIRAVGEGISKINVDLTPAELGRVQVRIEVGSDGRVQGTVTADRQDTFDMLQRDSRSLERALQDAGLKADSQSLSFNLRGESQQGRTTPENPAQEWTGSERTAEDAPPQPPPPAARPASAPQGAIDIRV